MIVFAMAVATSVFLNSSNVVRTSAANITTQSTVKINHKALLAIKLRSVTLNATVNDKNYKYIYKCIWMQPLVKYDA